ncbi:MULTISPECIES: hypothetical protein [Streptomyces]|uniref:hypothetical protein n=1 Tax=Streptomyces TaxID=1883 RepID=UPI000AE5B226|nr:MULTISPECIES: hypothetical protein [Streptomyces]RPK85191.1 hypothetical protein EES46_22860 [Streptomyces sp. ADI98-10]
MIVLSATNCSHQNSRSPSIWSGGGGPRSRSWRNGFNGPSRRGSRAPGTDVRSVAAFYATIPHGPSIEARDGVSPERLRSTVDDAVALWDTLVRQPVG